MKDIKIELNASNASGEAYWRKRCDTVEAELARLRAEKETYRRKYEEVINIDQMRENAEVMQENEHAWKENERLRAENERMRDVLKRIAAGVNCPEGVIERPDFYASQEYFERVANEALSRAEQAEQRPETCVWNKGRYGGWVTGCGFSTCTKYENCFNCGKRVEVMG